MREVSAAGMNISDTMLLIASRCEVLARELPLDTEQVEAIVLRREPGVSQRP
ncbi:MAG: hypothetical protein ACJ79O_20080 [Myxococcales bacterium]